MQYHEIANTATASQRAMAAARLYMDGKKRHKEWMANARKTFTPNEKEPCAVCGECAEISQAHHIYPLSIQSKNGIASANHSYVWLCPNHHQIIHMQIQSLMANQPVYQYGMKADHASKMDKLCLMFVEMLWGMPS